MLFNDTVFAASSMGVGADTTGVRRLRDGPHSRTRPTADGKVPPVRFGQPGWLDRGDRTRQISFVKRIDSPSGLPYRSPDSSQTTLAGQPVNVLLAQE